MKRIAILLLALFLAACSSRPGEVAVRSQAIAQLNANGGDRIYQVENFRKTNGIPRDDNNYDVEVEYDLRFKMDLPDAAHVLQGQSGSIFSAGMGTMALGMKYGDFKAGDVVHRKERLHFIRTEKGWRLEGPAKAG